VNAAIYHCSILQTTKEESIKYVIVGDGSMRDRVVQWCIKDIFGCCSCNLFKKMGIPCHHIILILRGEKIYELPSSYILQRCEARCKR
jgi:hypothetical protein